MTAGANRPKGQVSRTNGTRRTARGKVAKRVRKGGRASQTGSRTEGVEATRGGVSRRAVKPKRGAGRSGPAARRDATATEGAGKGVKRTRNAERRAKRGGKASRTAGKRSAPKAARSRLARVSLAGFPRLARQDGFGASLVVVERAGAKRERIIKTCELPLALTGNGGAGTRGRSPVGGLARANGEALADMCRALGTLGHVQRVRIMLKLLEGPATYRALERATRIKVGPLYHHINQLRLSGLILPKQRDLYELTRGGRNLVLAALVAGPLARNTRRRPYA